MVNGLLRNLGDYLKAGKNREPSQLLPSVRTDLNDLPAEGATLVWFGHSSYLLKIAGKGAHLERWGYSLEMMQELAWHEGTTDLDGGIRLTALPARHFSGRLFKRGQTLWSSFVLDTPDYKLYLGGDSGYDTHFTEIGEKYGPFDLAILECGQYNQNWPYIHMMPEQTAQAALDLRAKGLLPVHWGKFTLALHPWYEPIERVRKRAQELELPLATPLIGQPMQIGDQYPNTTWWR